MNTPQIQLLPGEFAWKDGPYKGRIHVTPQTLLQRRRRFEADIAPNGGTGAITSGGQTSFTFPQSDLLESLVLDIQATDLTNGGTYTTVAFAGWPNPVPFGLIKKISLSANGGTVNIFSLTGWGLYLYLRERTDVDIFKSNTTDKYCANNQKVLSATNPSSQTRAFNGGALAATTTYSLNLGALMPIAFNKQGDLALLPLQNESIYTLTIEWATTADLVVETSASGTGYTLAGTARLKGNFIKWLPTDVFEYEAQIGAIKSVREQVYPIQVGANAIQLVRDDWYTWIFGEVYNNGAPAVVTDITAVRLSHSNNEILANESYYTHLRQRFFDKHGCWPVDGTIAFDMRRRMGVPDRMDVMDAFNDRQIQNLTLGFDISSGTTLTGTQGVRIITESLTDAK